MLKVRHTLRLIQDILCGPLELEQRQHMLPVDVLNTTTNTIFGIFDWVPEARCPDTAPKETCILQEVCIAKRSLEKVHCSAFIAFNVLGKCVSSSNDICDATLQRD